MNVLDLVYQDLLQTIMDHGVEKETRNGKTKSIFGYQIRHDMQSGFPLLTTKKMYWKGIVTELLWFLRGDTNIKYLVDNDCHIWDGDAYKRYVDSDEVRWPKSKEDFIECIKTDKEWEEKWGDLGPIYGKQWRSWKKPWWVETELSIASGGTHGGSEYKPIQIDQIANLIHDLKTNPDSRRLMVNAWNVGELDQMVLPPCHYGFQVYTRELSARERTALYSNGSARLYDSIKEENYVTVDADDTMHTVCDEFNVPRRAISLMWNQRSVDTFLGLPFNIASYGLLLEIIAKAVNMVPDQLIGNLGDVHLYNNHIEQAKEQIGRDLTLKERRAMVTQEQFDTVYTGGSPDSLSHSEIDQFGVPKRTREPYPLPKLNINTEFWPYEGGECGEGPLDATAVFNSFKDDNFCKCLLEEDIQLGNYQSHPTIKAPLSN